MSESGSPPKMSTDDTANGDDENKAREKKSVVNLMPPMLDTRKAEGNWISTISRELFYTDFFAPVNRHIANTPVNTYTRY